MMRDTGMPAHPLFRSSPVMGTVIRTDQQKPLAAMLMAL